MLCRVFVFEALDAVALGAVNRKPIIMSSKHRSTKSTRRSALSFRLPSRVSFEAGSSPREPGARSPGDQARAARSKMAPRSARRRNAQKEPLRVNKERHDQRLELAEHAFRLCQQLLRIDTTNPPGNELPAAELLAGRVACRRAGARRAGERARARQRGRAASRHRGAATTPAHRPSRRRRGRPDRWDHPPFCGEVHDGCLWGRGAIDMKNMAAMSVAIITRLAREGVKPKRDLIFAGVADEEAGADMARSGFARITPTSFEVSSRSGRAGGSTSRSLVRASSRFRSPRRACVGCARARRASRATVRCRARTRRSFRLSEAIARLGKRGLPRHVSEPVQGFIGALAAHLPAPCGR